MSLSADCRIMRIRRSQNRSQFKPGVRCFCWPPHLEARGFGSGGRAPVPGEVNACLRPFHPRRGCERRVEIRKAALRCERLSILLDAQLA